MARDSLTHLPTEIMQLVLGYLEYERSSRGVWIVDEWNPSGHAFYALSLTCKMLRDCVDAYCEHRIRGYNHEMNKREKAKAAPPRVRWAAWVHKTCAFCKKDTTCRAMFFPYMACCRACDREQWDKRTITKAFTEFHLSQLDLITPNLLRPELAPVPFSVYSCMGGVAIMFRVADLERRVAEIYPGDPPRAFRVRQKNRRKKIQNQFGLGFKTPYYGRHERGEFYSLLQRGKPLEGWLMDMPEFRKDILKDYISEDPDLVDPWSNLEESADDPPKDEATCAIA